MKELKYYQCEFCKAVAFDRESMAIHENGCCHNPSKRACIACAHYSKERSENNPDGVKGKRSICRIGFSISGIREDRKNKRLLRTDCEYWVQRVRVDEKKTLIPNYGK